MRFHHASGITITALLCTISDCYARHCISQCTLRDPTHLACDQVVPWTVFEHFPFFQCVQPSKALAKCRGSTAVTRRYSLDQKRCRSRGFSFSKTIPRCLRVSMFRTTLWDTQLLLMLLMFPGSSSISPGNDGLVLGAILLPGTSVRFLGAKK